MSGSFRVLPSTEWCLIVYGALTHTCLISMALAYGFDTRVNEETTSAFPFISGAWLSFLWRKGI